MGAAAVGMTSRLPAPVADVDANTVNAAATDVAALGQDATIETAIAGGAALAGALTPTHTLDRTTPVAAGPAPAPGDRAEPALHRADASYDAVATAAAQSNSAVSPSDGTEPGDPPTATAAELSGAVPTGAAVAPLDSAPAPSAVGAAGSAAATAARRSPVELSGDYTAAIELAATDAHGAAGAPQGAEASSHRDPSGAADVTATPVVAVPSAATAATAVSPEARAAPGATGTTTIAAADAVRYLRELGPARAVQRLAVDLDGAMVAVRVDHTGTAPSVRVQVVDDPTGRLDAPWATSVERSLTQTMHRDGAAADQRRRERSPANPDDAQPRGASGRRWAQALGGDT